jgi:uncharacterized protein YecE (DUF72 family)
MTPSLFDDDSDGLRRRLQPKLAELAHSGVLIGTSSWKYPGWLEQIYSRDRYMSRGRFSQKRFEAECLGEYAETFPTVCGDFAFYQFPDPAFWEKLFRSVPPDFQFSFKVPEEITVQRFPTHARYGPRAGALNPGFLDLALFVNLFCEPLLPYRSQIGVLIFEFGSFAKELMPSAQDLVRLLDPFLAALPPDFHYAVEIRNADFLTAGYFACLARHNVAHVFNSWTRMPSLGDQLNMPGAFTADFTVVRALLRPGRPYEQAVERFSPYSEIRDEQPETRAALRELLGHGLKRGRRGYFYVNNRLEGSAPQTIENVIS